MEGVARLVRMDATAGPPAQPSHATSALSSPTFCAALAMFCAVIPITIIVICVVTLYMKYGAKKPAALPAMHGVVLSGTDTQASRESGASEGRERQRGRQGERKTGREET